MALRLGMASTSKRWTFSDLFMTNRLHLKTCPTCTLGGLEIVKETPWAIVLPESEEMKRSVIGKESGFRGLGGSLPALEFGLEDGRSTGVVQSILISGRQLLDTSTEADDFTVKFWARPLL
jgi:hypothetical protein